jgi:transposase
MNAAELLAEQARRRTEVKAVLDQCPPQAQAVIATLLAANEGMENQLRETLIEMAELKRMVFGEKSEKLTAEQEDMLQQVRADLEEAATDEASVAGDLLDEEAEQEKGKDETPDEQKKKRRRRAARNPMPEHLERHTTVLEPQNRGPCSRCGKELVRIGEEVTEELDYVPARLRVNRTVRPKYACACGQCGVVVAPLPPRLLPQSKLGLGLAVHLLLSRFDDHVAYYTLERIFQERHDVVVPRQQMVQWVEHIAFLLQPLCELMFKEMKKGDYLQIDETPVKVMDPEVKGKCARGYLWFYAVPGGDVFIDFQDTRGRIAPHGKLVNFAGTVQSDAYEVYDSLKKVIVGLVRIGCVAHLRRYFYAALLAQDPRAAEFILWLRRLYRIERNARGVEPSIRHEMRQRDAPGIWERMKTRAEELEPALLPQSRMGKAVNYLLNEYEPLKGYLADGRFEIDNNLVENSIRIPAVGRRRWLFIGHPDAGWRSAVIYSMIVSCRRRGINPQEYLTDVLRRLPAMNITQISELLPGRWKPVSPSTPVSSSTPGG